MRKLSKNVAKCNKVKKWRENMQFKNWCLTFLNIYRYLETISNSIDKLVGKYILKSSFDSSTTTYDVANKIIEYTERKKNLIKLQLIVDEAMAKMRLVDVKIIMLYYKDGTKSADIADMLQMGQRTFFRRKGMAVESFCKCMHSLGYSTEFFQEKFSKEHWLMNVYADVEEKSMKGLTIFEDKLKEYKFLKGLATDLSKVSLSTFNTYNSLSS